MPEEFRYKELTGTIIGAAMEVLNELRPGQDERVDERALEIELGLRGITVVRQRAFPVNYKGHPSELLSQT